VQALSRSSLCLLVAGLAVALFMLVGATADVTAQGVRSFLKGKELLPNVDLVKTIEASVKTMQSATKSASEFSQKSKALENEAYTLAIVVQAGRENDELAKKASALTDAALALAEAAKKKDFNEAKKQVALIADFKKMAGSDKTDAVNLGKTVPLKNLMMQVRDVDQELKKATRLNAAAWNQKGKAEEISLHTNRMVALTLAMLQHTPETDPDAKKGQTSKVWKESSQDTQDACLTLASAARAKKPDDFKKAYMVMDKACTKCHEVYRVETD
jgi:cytochrome c556